MKKILPSYSSGQILILILLIIVVGFTILLSIISRSLTDVRIATNTEATNRAYFAAEAGVEEALKKIAGGSISGGTIDFAAINKSTADYTINSAPSVDFNYPNNVTRDDSIQINLLTNYFNPAAGSYAGNLKICWGNSTSDKPAIETTLVYENPSGTFLAKKDAFDPDLTRILTNNFVASDAGTCTVGVTSYQFQKTLDYSTTAVPGVHYLLRIRLLYNTNAQPLGLTTAIIGGSPPLPTQGYDITSTGKTDLGTVRKLKVFKQYPGLPAIFDYVLFNGSTSPLTK